VVKNFALPLQKVVLGALGALVVKIVFSAVCF
jgi:hypothetical protein